MTSSGDPYLGRTLVKGFVLRRNLGSGEIGVVYEATNQDETRRIAIKILHPDVAEAHGSDLLRWAKRAAQIRHAKVATILGANRLPDGTIFIATEFVTGETLMGSLQKSGPMEPRRAADIMFQLCSALAPIHKAGRPHANLKPENVFVLPGDEGKDFVKIVDVGSPTIFGAHHLSDEREVVGAAKYFSPEQATGQSVGLPSDQFTLGVIGYLLLTGALPFFGATPDQLLDAIASSDPKPVRERAPMVPDLFADIIHKCLAKDPAHRYPDLRAVATDLAKVIKSRAAFDISTMPKRQVQESAAPTVMADAIDISVDLDASKDEAPDPDRTMVLSVPAEITDFLDEDRMSAAPAEIQEIPQPLSFSGMDDDDNIEADVDEPQPMAAPQPSVASIEAASPPKLKAKAATLSIEDELADALADAINEGTEDNFDASDQPLDLGAANPPPPSPSVSQASNPQNESSSHSSPALSGSLLPEDLISALETDIADEILEVPGAEPSVAAAPVATVADFDQVTDMSDRDKRSRLKSRGLGGVGRSGLSRPWMVVLLLIALVVAALAAKLSMQEQELEHAKKQESQNRKILERRAERERDARVELTFTIASDPENAHVFDGMTDLGAAPLTLKVTRGDYRTLTVKLQGYASGEKTVVGRTLDTDASKNRITVKLVPLNGSKDATKGMSTQTAEGKGKDPASAQPASGRPKGATPPQNSDGREKQPKAQGQATPKTAKSKKKRVVTKRNKARSKARPKKKAKKKNEDLENPFD